MLGSLLDNLIGVVSPRAAAQRIAYRQHLTRLKASSGYHDSIRRLMSGRNEGGYEAGKTDRLKGRVIGSPHENDLPRRQIEVMQWRSWNLHRNNPQARKIVRNMGAKVIGRGLSPQPQATKEDGTPFVEFRKRARLIWHEFSKECDFRGKPGRGGVSLPELAKVALKNVNLSGGALYRFRHLSPAQQKERDLYLPLQIQLIHIDRLDGQKHGDRQFYGAELDNEGRVKGYWLTRGGVLRSSLDQESVFVPVAQIGHLFATDDIDQILGSPWFGAAMLTMDDRRSYEYNELTAAEMGACLVAGYRRSNGQTGFGLQPQSGGPLADADGNPITHLQPGMLIDLGDNGELQTVNGVRPNSNAEGFLNYLMRSEAVGAPGVKSSTLTGDYRQSSFSSERSADNDVWPEIEDLQDWFANGFMQPIYEEVISTAVMLGLFDDVAGFKARDFHLRRRQYLCTNWQGPVARSINPKDDADAARLRVKNGTSSPQREAAQIGRDWREIVQEQAEFIEYCQELGLPDDIWQQALGIEQKDAESGSQDPPPDGTESDSQEDAQNRRSSSRFAAQFVTLNSAGDL